MSRPAPLIALSHDSVLDSLKTLDGWGYHQDSIYREYIFKTCPMAVSFITLLGFAAEKRNHHPEVFWVYNRVKIVLRTHDAGNKVTTLDIDSAHEIDTIFTSFKNA